MTCTEYRVKLGNLPSRDARKIMTIDKSGQSSGDWDGDIPIDLPHVKCRMR